MPLALKPLQLSDLDHVMTWVNDPEVVKNLQNFDKQFTREDEKQYLNKILASANDQALSLFNGETYVGQGGIHQISWKNKLGRLSLIIKREFWNKGYAQQALTLLIARAFQEIKLHKVWLMHWKENEKAAHLYQKLGFLAEGVLKDEYFWQGQFHDMVRMAMINPKE